MANKHPCAKHDTDHVDIWNAIGLCAWAMNIIEQRLNELNTTDKNIYESIQAQVEKISKNEKAIISNKENVWELVAEMKNMTDKYPKITTMKKTVLLVDGDNVIDTVELDSWRYLMVKNISIVDQNEYAKIWDLLSWWMIEVTNWKYDVNITLWSNTEWETATMTVNVDLLFVKY